jgi:hypothetical protein
MLPAPDRTAAVRTRPVSGKRRACIGFALGLTCASVGPAGAHDDPKNRLVSFRQSGAWEIWCVDVGGSGRVDCDLNIVLNYVPNPNFRAMIPRIYLADDGKPLVRIDYEWQTDFSRGFIQADDGSRYSLADCARPCRIDGREAQTLVDLLAGATAAQIHFQDYLVEAFDVSIDLDGFAEGLARLREMQAGHRAGNDGAQ